MLSSSDVDQVCTQLRWKKRVGRKRACARKQCVLLLDGGSREDWTKMELWNRKVFVGFSLGSCLLEFFRFPGKVTVELFSFVVMFIWLPNVEKGAKF